MKIAVITGGNSGVGKAVATEFAKKGYRVIIHGRDEAKTKLAAEEIKTISGNINVEYICADISVLTGMKALADGIKQKTDTINTLVLSTGVILPNRVVTADGLEMGFAVQYMSRFAVVQLLMAELKNRLWETLQFFDKHNHKTIAAFLWMDAATIANLSNSYAESLSYINKAVTYFKDEAQHEMTAQAQLVKGRLFYDWAQSGNPQFYRKALEAYHEALQVFKKEEAPDVFADIHHQLGVIYAELPDENKKRSIWAALSATSFSEALEYYNKVDFPYEFGMICNNFANAYSKYPQGNRTDNFEKALNYYEEALSVRGALLYPTERAVTLLNYLEASWKAGNPDEGFNTERYNDMLAKVNEIKTLTNDEQLMIETDKHIQLLEELEKELCGGFAKK